MRPQIVSSEATTTTANDTGGGSALALAQDENESYMRYEFSETRKVLDEFFHKDPAENDRFVFFSLTGDPRLLRISLLRFFKTFQLYFANAIFG